MVRDNVLIELKPKRASSSFCGGFGGILREVGVRMGKLGEGKRPERSEGALCRMEANEMTRMVNCVNRPCA